MLVVEIGVTAATVSSVRTSSAASGGLMVAVRGGQPRLEELRPARVPQDHVIDVDACDGPLDVGVGPGACPDRRVDGQDLPHAAEAFLGSVVRGADQIELAELREDLQQLIIALAVLDLLPSDSNSSFAATSSAAMIR